MLLKYLHHVLTILPILSLPLLLLKIPVPSNCIPLIHILRGSSIYFIFIFFFILVLSRWHWNKTNITTQKREAQFFLKVKHKS